MVRSLGLNSLTVLTKARPFPDHLLTDGDFSVIYRFGKFELDDSTRELRKDGQRVDVEPKAFEMLVFLLANRDRAVGKDELLNELWPHQIVSETALTRSVMKARRAVGDDSSTQAVIRTLHGHGYRWVAELEASQPAPARRARRPGRAKPVAGLVAALAIVLIAVGLYLREPATDDVFVGALAVLPVHNLVEDDELTWVRVGLMSILKRMLEDGGIRVASDRSVLKAVGDAPLAGPPDDSMFTRLRHHTGSDAVLHTTLERKGGLQRLSAIITHADGRKTRRVIVGESPATLAAQMASVIVGLAEGDAEPVGGRFARVSTDPFVNEMYARALDLELQGKYAEARKLFEVASNQEPELFWLRYEIALCTRDLREWNKAAELFEALHEEASSGEDSRAAIATLNSHGVMLFNLHRYDDAEQMFLDSLDAAAERSHALDRATTHINLALIGGRRGDIDMAKQHYESALGAYGEAGEDPTPVFLNNYAGLLLELGDLEQAQEYVERAIDGFRLRGQRAFEAKALNRLAKTLRRRGDTEAAIEKHKEAMTINRELGDTGGELSVMSALTVVYRGTGDLTRAKLNAMEVIARAEDYDDELLSADAYMQLAYVEASFENHAGAIAEFEAAAEIFERIGEDSGVRAANMGIALAALELGDVERAETIAQSMLQAALAANHPGAEARARWLIGKVALESGDLAGASEAYGAALAYARSSNDESALARAASGLAETALARGDLEQASALVEEIRAGWKSHFDFQRLDARLAVAQGDEPRAREIMTALRSSAGESWTADDEELFDSLVE